VGYLHKEHKVAHRDLKPDNVIVEDQGKGAMHVKLIDFGFSVPISGQKKLRTFCGTPSFMAPEIVMRKEYDGQMSDVWALGIMLYNLVYGKCPFRGHNESDLYRCIKKGTFTFPDEVYPIPEEFKGLRVSDGLKNLVRRILVVNASRRPTCE